MVEKAVSALHNTELNGKPLVVNAAQERPVRIGPVTGFGSSGGTGSTGGGRNGRT
jgi:hypothetical protein